GGLGGLAPARSASARLSAMTSSAEQRREGLIGLYREVSSCTRCPLHEGRTRAVFGAGNATAELMFVGEAPGAEEDRQGLPFVGRAGQLLNQLLEENGISREEVFIRNVLKKRPPGPCPSGGARSASRGRGSSSPTSSRPARPATAPPSLRRSRPASRGSGSR